SLSCQELPTLAVPPFVPQLCRILCRNRFVSKRPRYPAGGPKVLLGCFLEGLVCRIDVVPIGNHIAIAKPFCDHRKGVSPNQVGFTTGPQVMP
ncbi:MAG: hypothetical protein RMI90_15415, partial [Thermoguttaceae bacterium]|nr:hypothetical protein [Thermoguttaceae bacterium]